MTRSEQLKDRWEEIKRIPLDTRGQEIAEYLKRNKIFQAEFRKVFEKIERSIKAAELRNVDVSTDEGYRAAYLDAARFQMKWGISPYWTLELSNLGDYIDAKPIIYSEAGSPLDSIFPGYIRDLDPSLLPEHYVFIRIMPWTQKKDIAKIATPFQREYFGQVSGRKKRELKKALCWFDMMRDAGRGPYLGYGELAYDWVNLTGSKLSAEKKARQKRLIERRCVWAIRELKEKIYILSQAPDHAFEATPRRLKKKGENKQ